MTTQNDLTRRHFLSQAGKGLSAVWLSANWPAIVAAAGHARQAALSPSSSQFQFFSPEEAREIDAMCARIIPTDSTPGAREAGAIYFIDRALVTFAVDDQKTYKEGLPGLQAKTRELFPSVARFSEATPEQQDEILRSIDDHAPQNRRPFRSGDSHNSFFETVRLHALVAFLVDPESGGNRDAVGWKVIGRDPDHMFQPPFGFYDKDYAGWQPNSPSSEKGKS